MSTKTTKKEVAKATNTKVTTKVDETKVEKVGKVTLDETILSPIQTILAINYNVEVGKLRNEIAKKTDSIGKELKKDSFSQEKIDKLTIEKDDCIKRLAHFEEKFESHKSSEYVNISENMFEFLMVYLVNNFNEYNNSTIEFSDTSKIIGSLHKLYNSMGSWNNEDLKACSELIASFINKYIPHIKPSTMLENLDSKILKLPIAKYEKNTFTFTFKAFQLPKNIMATGYKPMHITTDKVNKFLPSLVSKLGKTMSWNDKGIVEKGVNDNVIIKQVLLYCLNEVLDFEVIDKKEKNTKNTITL